MIIIYNFLRMNISNQFANPYDFCQSIGSENGLLPPFILDQLRLNHLFDGLDVRNLNDPLLNLYLYLAETSQIFSNFSDLGV